MKYKVTLNGKTYEVEVEENGNAIMLDEYEAVAPKAPVAEAPVAQAPATPAAPAAAPAGNASANAVKAPLPGTILQIKGQVGQAVKAGETVIIIEAMKMENEIVAPRDGTITAIYAQKGTTVANGTPLFEIA